MSSLAGLIAHALVVIGSFAGSLLLGPATTAGGPDWGQATAIALVVGLVGVIVVGSGACVGCFWARVAIQLLGVGQPAYRLAASALVIGALAGLCATAIFIPVMPSYTIAGVGIGAVSSLGAWAAIGWRHLETSGPSTTGDLA